MAGFRQGGLSLKHRDNGAASDINYVSFYVDSLDRLYSVDEFGTSALVSNQWSTGCIDSDIQSLIRTTDNITIPTQNVAIFSNANFRGPLYRKTITSASFSIPRDGQSKYVVVDYDNGTPYYRIETDRTAVNQSNVVCLYIVWNVSGSIHAIEFDNKGEGLANKIDNSILLTTPYRRSIDGGLIISVDASRYIQVTPAVVFAGTTPISILSFTSQTDRVTEISHSSGNWSFTETMAGYQVDNLYYDNGTDKVAANNNKYICRWVYRTIGDDKEVFVRLGTSEYNNLSDAQKESEPNNPGIAKEHAMLIGRIIIQKAATTCVYESIFTIFGASQGTSVSNHNDLNNIQGGDQVGSNYYHLDLLRYSYTSAISADVQTQLNNLQMLTSGTGITQVYADAHYLKLDGTNGPITSNLGVTGTISTASVSAIDISGTTLNVGNISNAEFSRLDGISANIQTQLSNLSGANSAKVDKTTQVIAGSGLVGGGTLSANVTISLSTINTAGTYPKVTTDNYGRVISGTALLASDIPTGIDASKISTGTVSNTEFGYLDGVSANIQTQLSNLSGANSNKANSSILISGTSGLIGGGDLTQNRNIGLPNVGSAGTYTKVTTDQYGRVSAGTSLTSGDIPTLPPSKILEDANDRFVTDVQIGKWDSVYNSVSGTSANWNSVFFSVSATSASWNAASVSAHNHGNKTILDQINQSVATSANVLFTSVSATNISGTSLTIGNISNTEFGYLDTVSANIQTQLSNLSGTDTTKADKSTTITAGTGLTGGGDLSTNRTISLATTGTEGTYSNIVTNAYGQVTSARAITSADIPTLPATKIGTGIIDDSEFNRLDGVSANIQTQLSNLSGTNNAKVDKTTIVSAGAGLVGGGSLSANVTISLSALNSAGTYTKVTTDNYGRVLSGTSLIATDIPSGIDASKISTGTISNTEFGYLDGISANIQNQLSYLSGNDSNKASSLIIISGTSGLTGGGDLTQNRYIGLPNVGAAGTYTKVTTDQYGRVSAGTSLTSGDIPTIPPSKILEDANDRFVTDIQIGKWDSVYNSVSGTSANWNSVYASVSATSASWNAASVSAHNHGNKTILDQINQSVATSANVLFASVSATNISGTSLTIGNISNTEFGYLDTVSANIQTQLSNISGVSNTKVDKITQVIAGTGLVGGGSLSANVTISLPSIGTAGTYTKVSTDAQGRVSAASNITSADVPTLPATKIGTGIIDDIEFNYLNGVSANIQTQLSSLSGSDSNKIDRTAVQPYLGIYRDPSTLAYQANLLYDPSSRTVSLSSPTSAYPKNQYGTPKTISGSLGSHTNATNTYFYYLDTSGNIQISTNAWNLLTDCPIALVYYNASQTSGVAFEERHSHDRNPEAHKQQHLSIGTFCNPYPSIGGYTLTPSSPVSADNIYTITPFTMYDEDIIIPVSTITSATPKQVFYQSGANHDWTYDGYDPYGYSYGTFIKYNQFTGATYTLTELGTNEYVNYYVFGIPTVSGSRILTIPGTSKYSALATAQAETFSDVLNSQSLPLQEWVLLFKITYRTNNSYTTPGKCRIENVVSYTGTKVGTTLAGTGITQAFADSTYLRLDGSNDPINGDIVINSSLSAISISGSSLTIGNVTNTEFNYLDGVSANIQTQINNILNGTTGKFTSAINISVGNQTIVVNHNLGYLRPTVKIYHEATNTEIFVCPIFTSTSQLSLPILSSSVFSSARLEVYV